MLRSAPRVQAMLSPLESQAHTDSETMKQRLRGFVNMEQGDLDLDAIVSETMDQLSGLAVHTHLMSHALGLVDVLEVLVRNCLCMCVPNVKACFRGLICLHTQVIAAHHSDRSCLATVSKTALGCAAISICVLSSFLHFLLSALVCMLTFTVGLGSSKL